MKRRILYVQFTNAANYPPLEHSATMLADAGCEVLFLEMETQGGMQFDMAPHPRIRRERMPHMGTRGYPKFMLRAVQLARAFQPDWCYASDDTAAPAALLVKTLTGARLVYHEHDAPAGRTSMPGQVAAIARRRILDVADIVVVPSAGRRALLGSRGDRSIVVWNCPLTSEVSEKTAVQDTRITLTYAGSLSPDRIPATFIRALAQLPVTVDLRVFGYETIGFPDYYGELHTEARRLGLATRVSRSIAPSRGELLAELSTCDIGIATLNLRSGDANVQSMLGASNKPFDYLSAGLPILVSDAQDWIRTFVEPGYARSCDPDDVASIVTAVQPLLDPAVRHGMAAAGRARLLSDWNYERQFAPVFERLVS